MHETDPHRPAPRPAPRTPARGAADFRPSLFNEASEAEGAPGRAGEAPGADATGPDGLRILGSLQEPRPPRSRPPRWWLAGAAVLLLLAALVAYLGLRAPAGAASAARPAVDTDALRRLPPQAGAPAAGRSVPAASEPPAPARIEELAPGPPAAAGDDDVALIEAVVRHGAARKPAAASSAVVAEQLRRCDAAGGLDAVWCRWRVCAERWGRDPACPKSAQRAYRER